MNLADSLSSSVSYDIFSHDELKKSINNDITCTRSSRRRPYIPKPFTVVSYGPINVRVIHADTPNLKTGRLSKFIPLEGEEAMQRELRRQRKREAARKIKEKRTNIEETLLNEITELESKEKDLSQNINNLQSYKNFLQKVYEQKAINKEKIIQTMSLNTSEIQYDQQDIPSHCELEQIKEELRPPSPPWQLSFSI